MGNNSTRCGGGLIGKIRAEIAGVESHISTVENALEGLAADLLGGLYKGEYDLNLRYYTGYIVSVDGTLYQSTIENNQDTPPSASWRLLSEVGVYIGDNEPPSTGMVAYGKVLINLVNGRAYSRLADGSIKYVGGTVEVNTWADMESLDPMHGTAILVDGSRGGIFTPTNLDQSRPNDDGIVAGKYVRQYNNTINISWFNKTNIGSLLEHLTLSNEVNIDVDNCTIDITSERFDIDISKISGKKIKIINQDYPLVDNVFFDPEADNSNTRVFEFLKKTGSDEGHYVSFSVTASSRLYTVVGARMARKHTVDLSDYSAIVTFSRLTISEKWEERVIAEIPSSEQKVIRDFDISEIPTSQVLGILRQSISLADWTRVNKFEIYNFYTNNSIREIISTGIEENVILTGNSLVGLDNRLYVTGYTGDNKVYVYRSNDVFSTSESSVSFQKIFTLDDPTQIYSESTIAIYNDTYVLLIRKDISWESDSGSQYDVEIFTTCATDASGFHSRGSARIEGHQPSCVPYQYNKDFKFVVSNGDNRNLISIISTSDFHNYSVSSLGKTQFKGGYPTLVYEGGRTSVAFWQDIFVSYTEDKKAYTRFYINPVDISNTKESGTTKARELTFINDNHILLEAPMVGIATIPKLYSSLGAGYSNEFILNSINMSISAIALYTEKYNDTSNSFTVELYEDGTLLATTLTTIVNEPKYYHSHFPSSVNIVNGKVYRVVLVGDCKAYTVLNTGISEYEVIGDSLRYMPMVTSTGAMSQTGKILAFALV